MSRNVSTCRRAMIGITAFRPLTSTACAVALCALLASGLAAQRGDRKGENQPPLPDSVQVPAAPALTPEQGLASLRIAPGFQVTLAAAEPLVEDPVMMRFDARGRAWVVEMRSYMPNVDGDGERAPLGRIVILEDEDGDGTFDRSDPWLEDLVLPRGLFVFEDGALVIEPPSLWFYRDTDGDGRADAREHVADGFEKGLTSVEHCGNGMVWGADGWLYLAKHPSRFRRTADGWEEQRHPRLGQWGLTRTDDGRLLYNYNSSYLHGDLIPSSYAGRNGHLGLAAGCNINLHKDQTVWPRRMNPGVNRGYQKGLLREDYTLSRFTATCSPEIYRGHLMVDAVGDAFVCEPSGNFVRRSRITDEGLTFTAAHIDPGDEFLTSTDERFRPVSLHTGPDGALYVVDLYRGILQHGEFVTTFLRRQILERGLDKPLGLGRIYRVSPAAPTAGATAGDTMGPPQAIAPESWDLTALDPAALVAQLRHPNGWRRDMAQRLLVERRPTAALASLRALVRDGEASGVSRSLGLWTLHLLERLPRRDVLFALRCADPAVRATGLRLAEALFADRRDELVVALMASVLPTLADREALQWTLSASAMGELSLLAQVMATRSGAPLFRDAALTGLEGRELEWAQVLVADPALAAVHRDPGVEALLRRTSRCVGKERNGARVLALIELASRASQPWQGAALLEGLQRALPKGKAAEGFFQLADEPVALAPWLDTADPAASSDARHAAAVALLPALHWGEPIPEPELSAAVKARFSAGRAVYGRTCVNCHQRSGLGMNGLAPPLAGSEWVSDGPEALLRVILGGLNGPIEVDGQGWDKAMEAHGFLSDDDVAAVATFVRMSWDNGADPVEPTEVASLRAEAEQRSQPYPARELRR